MDLFRETPLGQLLRLVWRPDFLLYPEEKPGFTIPSPSPLRSLPDSDSVSDVEKQDGRKSLEATSPPPSQRKPPPDGIMLVDWYGDDDPDNPQNWSSGKKAWTTFVLFLLLLAAYGASSIYVPSIPGVIAAFGVSISKASLGLSLYVIGIGAGPMLFSPLSEIPSVGRNWPYIVTTTIFVILAAPTAVVDDYASLMALRAITGFFGSPAMATGPASLQDIYSPTFLPFALCFAVLAPFSAPAIAPMLSGFAVMYKDWHWSLWIILWLSAPVLLLMWTSLPETSGPNILLRRAARLRKLTGNLNYKSQSEIDQSHMTARKVLSDALIKPVEISVLDPAIFFTNLYVMYIYGTYYSFFEAFPIAFSIIHGFDLAQLGLAFLPIAVGAVIGAIIYFFHIVLITGPRIQNHSKPPPPPEFHLIPAMYGSVFLPVALFIFAWTARPDVPWIVLCIATAIYAAGGFLIMQAAFLYLPLSYPQYAASLFAANDLCRSFYAAGAVIFSEPMFRNLGIGRGVSVLGGLGAGGVVGIWLLWFFGAKLRARSRFAVS